MRADDAPVGAGRLAGAAAALIAGAGAGAGTGAGVRVTGTAGAGAAGCESEWPGCWFPMKKLTTTSLYPLLIYKNAVILAAPCWNITGDIKARVYSYKSCCELMLLARVMLLSSQTPCIISPVAFLCCGTAQGRRNRSTL
jgi:hypothetical protein